MCAAAALAEDAAARWKQLEFLAGTWVTKGDSELGRAEGSSTFAFELGGQILVRRSWVKYSGGRGAGTRHDDLLIVYAEGPAFRAIYFDGEGHVIRYSVAIPSPGVAVLESEASGPGPRFRLTHAVQGREMQTKFEIAPPGGSGYKTYVSGTSTRQ